MNKIITFMALLATLHSLQMPSYNHQIGGQSDVEYDYSIISLVASQVEQSGTTTGIINISTLPRGLYILSLTDNNTGSLKTLKFTK